MDGREAMAMSGPPPAYYMHRGMGAPGPGPGPHPGLHGPPTIRPLATQNPGLAHIGGSGGGSVGPGFPLESSLSSAMSLQPHGGVNVGVGGAAFVADSGEPPKRKRGRPRKYGPDGNVALALSPLSATHPSGSAAGNSRTGTTQGSGLGSGRRGRGRPPGSGRKQQLASLGEWVAGSAGMGFTPHIVTIDVGEDITSKIMSFAQQGPRAICILSANGVVSTVTLRQSATSAGTVTYEGRFEILCLSGSYTVTEVDGGSRSRTGSLTISLSSPDGRVIGGGVGGSLIAATPVQVIVGSFLYGGPKLKNKPKTDQELVPEHDLLVDDKQSPQMTNAMPSQGLASQVMGGWPGSRQMDMRNSLDIDLTRG